MCKCSACLTFDKATNGQTVIKHEMEKSLSSMLLLKIGDEKLTHFVFYICPFVALSKAMYADNSHIVLSSRYYNAFIFNLLCVLICFLELMSVFDLFIFYVWFGIVGSVM